MASNRPMPTAHIGQQCSATHQNGHALQIAKEQRRVADGCETTADVRHDEDKEDDVVRGDAIFIHADPWTDEQHRRAGRSQKIGDDRADEQKTTFRNGVASPLTPM